MSLPARGTPSSRGSGTAKTNSRPSSNGPPPNSSSQQQQQQSSGGPALASSSPRLNPERDLLSGNTVPVPPSSHQQQQHTSANTNNNSSSSSNHSSPPQSNTATIGPPPAPPPPSAAFSSSLSSSSSHVNNNLSSSNNGGDSNSGTAGATFAPPPPPAAAPPSSSSSSSSAPAAPAAHASASAPASGAPQAAHPVVGASSSSMLPPSSSATTAAASVPGAPHPPSTSGAGAAIAAAPATRVRPVMQLTQNLVQTYHDNNEKIFAKKRLEAPGPKHNDGYDDPQGHYIVHPGEEIIGRYAVIETLGRGSFGTVVKAYDTRRKEMVAAKITRSGRGFRDQAKLEIDILMKMLTQAPDSKTVRILKAFDWKGHLVIVFEILSFNLYQLLQCTNYHGVSLDLTSKFAFQLLMVLRDLERLNPPVIHCDLKPENVLLVNQNRSAIRVIDFGSACYLNRRLFRYIQSRYYRSPEVILNLEYGTAIDRWSLGCVLVELHTGVALFDGRNEAQQLQRFEGLLGPLPHHMIATSPKRDNFYDTVTDTVTGQTHYQLKLQPEPQHIRTLQQVLERTQRRRNHSSASGGGSSSSAAAAVPTVPGTTQASSGGSATGGDQGGSSGDTQERYEQFMDLIKKLLEYDPAKRIGVLPSMEHPFLCEFMPYYLQRTANAQQHQQQQQLAQGQQSAGAAAASGGSGGGSGTNSAAASMSQPPVVASSHQQHSLNQLASASSAAVPHVTASALSSGGGPQQERAAAPENDGR